jgi:Zn-finger nucleic acid-binding protein
MKLINYLHYYIGCDYWTNNSQGNLNAKTLPDVIDMCERGKGVQLHLRRLEDMTEEERTEIFGKDVHWYKPFDANDACDIQQWHKLLQKGFDLFGLIDASIAIDAKTITQ